MKKLVCLLSILCFLSCESDQIMNLNDPKTIENATTRWGGGECPGFDYCVDFTIDDIGNGMIGISWSSPSCSSFNITGIGQVYSSHGSEMIEAPSFATDYTMSCSNCGSCSRTIRVYPNENGGISFDDDISCPYEFYHYSFEISYHGEYNYSRDYSYPGGNMVINVVKIKEISYNSDDSYNDTEFTPQDITDWVESGELGDKLPAERGYTYEMCFSNRSCTDKDNHYYSVCYTYEDVMNAPTSLNSHIVNNHKKK